ncbi:MAG: hypothetical protein JWP61_1344 [Friedmanniella sp.]|nr:hypothetical protein [Friedmanniella sp.]
MRDPEYDPEDIGAYGATEQPAVAARMVPHLRLVWVGAGVALLGTVTAAGAVATFPAFSSQDTGRGWAVAALGAAVGMLAACVVQVLVWRRAMASWRGVRPQDLRTEVRLSWVAHLASYAVALLALVASMTGSAYAGWSTTAAALLAVTLVAVLAAQVIGAVQYLRTDGPPGTVPVHLRRLVERSRHAADNA